MKTVQDEGVNEKHPTKTKDNGAVASSGSTMLWLVLAVVAYVGIQWVMPKVGVSS